jgi:hypothetical protein
MSAAELLQRIQSLNAGSPLPWTKIREEISDEYEQASPADRVTLLNIYKVVMDGVERHIGLADLETFRTARRQDYKRLLISECIVGEGDVSPDALEAVTRREVVAGRMAPDDELRRLAILGPEGLAAQQSQAPKTKGWRRVLGRWGRSRRPAP